MCAVSANRGKLGSQTYLPRNLQFSAQSRRTNRLPAATGQGTNPRGPNFPKDGAVLEAETRGGVSLSTARTVVIKGPQLWDGTGKAMIKDGVVIVEGGKVTGVGPARSLSLPEGKDVSTFDYPGCTICPGFIDTHVHLNWPGDGTPAHIFTIPKSDVELAIVSATNARRALRSGVTTVRDVGSRGRTVLDLRNAINAGQTIGPRIVAAAAPITKRGGHMGYMGAEADSALAVRSACRNHWKMGADFFKLVANGGGTPRTHSWIPSYSEQEIAAAVAEARDHETHVTVHANSVETIRRCTSAGVNGMEHCTFLEGGWKVLFDPKIAEDIAKKGIYIGHTFPANYRSLLKARADRNAMSDEDREYWDLRERAKEATFKNFNRMLDMGVRIVASTDAGWSLTPYGEYVVALETFCEAGATPVQSLESGTRIAAEALQLADKIGTLESGKRADVTIVKGDPTKKISDAWNVRAVFRDGALLVDDDKLVA